MLQYIKDIFKLAPITVMSWGIEYLTPVFECEEGEGGCEMRVNGFRHTGRVRVMLNWADLFDVTLFNEEGEIKEKVTDVYVDNLVPVIDNLVECVEDYSQRVINEYQLEIQ